MNIASLVVVGSRCLVAVVSSHIGSSVIVHLAGSWLALSGWGWQRFVFGQVPAVSRGWRPGQVPVTDGHSPHSSFLFSLPSHPGPRWVLGLAMMGGCLFGAGVRAKALTGGPAERLGGGPYEPHCVPTHSYERQAAVYSDRQT